MKRFCSLTLAFCLCAMLLSGCSQPASPPEDISYTWQEMAVSLPLDEEEYYTLLAADEGDLLLAVSVDVPRDHPDFGETSINGRTQRLIRYSVEDGIYQVLRTFEEDVYCSSGAFLTSGDIAYVCMMIDGPYVTEQQVRKISDGEERVLYCGKVSHFSPVTIAPMEDDVLAVAYEEMDTGVFGLTLFTEENEAIEPLRFTSDDIHQCEWNDNLTGGAECVYLTTENEDLVLYCVNATGEVTGKFALTEEERFYSACPVGKHVLVSIQTGMDETGGLETAFLIKDKQGKNRLEEEAPALLRLHSTEKGILANDMDWHLYFLTVSEDGRQVNRMEIDYEETGMRWYDTVQAGPDCFIVRDMDNGALWHLQVTVGA